MFASRFIVVSIHAPARGATRSCPRCGARPCFNPRARAGRDHAEPSCFPCRRRFQSTRPRGARRRSAAASFDTSVFQSTRPRGARHDFCRSLAGLAGFNPRARAGRDHERGHADLHDNGFQSTRPRGARHRLGSYSIQSTQFQSTRPRGARPVVATTIDEAHEFQSTRPRGARRDTDLDTLRRHGSFNPRARAGRDAHAPAPARRDPVSIHAPARGATSPSACSDRSGLACFNPRARAGRDLRYCPERAMKSVFQSTRPRGARPRAVASPSTPYGLFQSTRPRGARTNLAKSVRL